MAIELTTSYLKDAIYTFLYYKKLADTAMAQISDEALFTTLDPESNSIAILVKHLSGNMRSRWTDFLTTDGEKPTRDRDAEFEDPSRTRAELITLWESDWKLMMNALSGLTDADLDRTIRIRGEAHSVMQAIDRNLTHTSYHVGQIVFLAKHFAGADWKTLTKARRKPADAKPKA